jgi:uncharacterized protein YyaL (SSP411 family)
MTDAAARGAQNRLSRESSPYLRQHADNPVDWYTWTPEALERARAENKPILLSIGYSACHWCHVMAHESFEDPGIAKLMNEYFINIKVDREERPDLDQLYQGVVQLMGRGGGWPLTVFLTPDLRPFFGGTYFPPVDKFGTPAFPKILRAVNTGWSQQRDEILKQAKQFETGLIQLAGMGLETPASGLSIRDVVSAAEDLEGLVDWTHGGFGQAPKFPNPMNLALLLRGYRRTASGSLLSAVTLALESMAKGGIYDQLGGGFHRYSVDERWLVPHFEKMLYDNAQLLHLYAEAQQISPNPLWRKVVEETVEYVRREMTSPEGGFYATQDADSEGQEGKFFVWTPQQVSAVLSPSLAELAKEHFGITEQGNFEDGFTVLEMVEDAKDLAVRHRSSAERVESDLAAARKQMFDAREKRIKPGRDEKILAGWNGLMIRGLAFASRVFKRPEWVALARGAAEMALLQLWRGDRLFRARQDGANRIEGFIEDYGGLAAGLVALYQACFDPRYLEAAEALVNRAVELFWDEDKQAYRSAPKDSKDLFCATYALHDNAFPSGASTLTEAQVALAAITGRQAHFEQAGKYLRKMREGMLRNPFGYGHLLLAADNWLEGAAEVALVGSEAQVQPLLDAVNSSFAPTLSLSFRDPAAPPAAILAEAMQGREPLSGKAAAYLCRNFSCQPPITDGAQLKAALSQMPERPS